MLILSRALGACPSPSPVHADLLLAAYSGLRFRSKTAYSVMIFMLPDLHCKYAKYSVWIPLRNTQIFERKRNPLYQQYWQLDCLVAHECCKASSDACHIVVILDAAYGRPGFCNLLCETKLMRGCVKLKPCQRLLWTNLKLLMQHSSMESGADGTT